MQLREQVSRYQQEKDSYFTYTGKLFDPINPDPELIDIVDIAHATSNMCRYGGHVPRFYSVAEHSVAVAMLMKEDGRPLLEIFAGLMHDAEEAYLPDMPTPIKRQFPEYAAAGDALRKVIFAKFGLDYDLYAKVRPYDEKAYEIERATLWPPRTKMRPQDAKTLFLNKFMACDAMLKGLL